MNIRRGKFLITLGGVAVLVAGVFIGAFLVLRSETGEGKLYAISNSTTKSTQELLDELYQIHSESSNSNQPPKNLTEDFLTTVSAEGERLGLNPADYGSEDFLYSTILPYLSRYQDELFPLIPSGQINADESISRREYARSLKPYFETFKDIFNFLGKIPTKFLNPLDPEIIYELSLKISLLSTNFEELLTLPVPPNQIEFHKRTLQLSLGLQKTLESYADANADPLRALLFVNQFDEVILFAEQLFNEFSRL